MFLKISYLIKFLDFLFIKNKKIINSQKILILKINNMDNNLKPIIGIDLGTTYSCTAIIRNNEVNIIQDEKIENKILPSIVCFKSETQCLIDIIA